MLGATVRRITRYIKITIKRVYELNSVNIVHPGAVTVIQRASTDLSANLHFHSLFTDGAFVRLGEDEKLTFLELPAPPDDEIADIAWDIARSVRKELWLANCWEDGTADEERIISGMFVARDNQATACRFTGVAANGAARPDGVGAVNVDASGEIRRGDHENLCQTIAYMLSPAIRDKQLTVQRDGVLFELKRMRTDGTTHRRYTFDQILDRLAFLVPPEWANLIRFHGIYAPNCKLRADVVPQRPEPRQRDPQASSEDEQTPDDYRAWAELQTHAFPDDIMRCPKCGGRLKLVALTSRRTSYRRGQRKPPN